MQTPSEVVLVVFGERLFQCHFFSRHHNAEFGYYIASYFMNNIIYLVLQCMRIATFTCDSFHSIDPLILTKIINHRTYY